MLRNLIIVSTLVIGVVFSSCGTNKKLKAANAQNQELQATNSQLMAKQKELQNQVDNLIAANQSVNTEYSRYRTSCESTNQQLKDVRAAQAEDEKALQAFVKKITDALADFQDRGVNVYEKDRVIYIDMEDHLLYKSGSAAMGEEGKKALGALASALNDYPDLMVLVVGNTDDQKFKNSNTDNLSLSTERANGVVRVLRDTYKVDPTRLVSAGRGKYHPMTDNSTVEGRAKNRRTEIVLRPDYVKLWESVLRQSR
jgi:chemotaxis protein MotB